MKLEDIPWRRCPCGDNANRPCRVWLWEPGDNMIVARNDLTGLYNINHHAPDGPHDHHSSDKYGRWEDIDVATAQAILFHIFPDGVAR